MDIWAAIDQEREALVEDLALIDDSQWDAQSLCAEWEVRDVVGHLVFAANSDWKDFAVGLVKNMGNLDRVISIAATEVGAAPPFDLERQFADTVGAGRGDALDELSGDGLAQLRTKIGAV